MRKKPVPEDSIDAFGRVPISPVLHSADCRRTAHKHFWRAAAVLGLVLFTLSSAARELHAQAQAFNASLIGTVYDNSAAAVAGAAVTLSNPDKGFIRSFVTGSDGHYAFTLVPAGTYTLKVEMSGFRPYTQSGIVLTVGQVAEQNVTLQLGAVTQEITVSASLTIASRTRL
jgi:hypothetical protein